jgi:hypothetical protein
MEIETRKNNITGRSRCQISRHLLDQILTYNSV